MNGTPRTNGTVSPDRLLQTARGNLSVWATLVSNSLVATIHLLPEIALGVLVSEAISRVTKNRVGPGLQVIAGAAVVFGILVSTMTVGARIFQHSTGGFPPLDKLLATSLDAISNQFATGNFGVLIFWIIGVAFAAIRLKR